MKSLGDAINPAAPKPCCFEIQGHTDSVGKASYNERFSQKRAEAVVQYLAEHNGVERDRMIARGFGLSQPIASNVTAKGRAKDRRVQIVNLGYETEAGD